jgi:hypothetical protein
VDEPAAGQGQVGLDRVEFPAGSDQRARITFEEGTLVEQPGPFDPVIRVQ